LVGWLVGWLVGLLVRNYITLNVIFSAVYGRIDLKFGRDLHIDLLFQFLFFFFLSSSSNSFSSFSSEIKLIYLKAPCNTTGCLLSFEERNMLWWQKEAI
jgi:hypothetical protein